MEGPDLKLVSGSASIKPSMASNCSDENNQSFEEIGFDLNESNNRKAKISSSPTISAASKTNNSENVLAERNDISRSIIPEINPTQTISGDLKPKKEIHTPLDPGLDNADSSLSQNSPLSSYSYDPLTNYVSPRPKFLRYKPNRLREIYLRRKNEDSEEKEESRSESMASGEAINDDDVTSESRDTGFIMEDDDDEEVEEETCWNLKGVLKFMILLLVLLSLTMYISSMNSPEPSMSLQAFGGFTLKDGYEKIQKHVYEFIQIPESWHHNFLFKEIMRAKMGVLRLDQILSNDGFKEGEDGFLLNEENAFIEDEEKTLKAIGAEEKNVINKLGDPMEVESETFDQMAENVEIVQNQNVEPVDQMAENVEIVQNQNVEPFDEMAENVEIVQSQNVEPFDHMAENVEIVQNQNVEPFDHMAENVEIVQNQIVEPFDHMAENVEIVQSQNVEQVESLCAEEEAVDLEDRKSETFDEMNENVEFGEKQSEEETQGEITEVESRESNGYDQMKCENAEEEHGGLPFFSGATSNVMEKDIEAVIDSIDEQVGQTINKKLETKNKNAMDLETIDSEAETKEKELFFKVIIGGVFAVLTIITSFLLWGYKLKRKSIVGKESSSSSLVTNPVVAKKRKRVSTKEPLVTNHFFDEYDHVVTPKINSEMLSEKDECIEQVVSLLNTMSLTPNSMDDEEMFQTRPPAVELLGEIVVGHSNRETDSAYMDSGLRSNMHLVPVRVRTRTDISEISTTVSSSYGSFTSDIVLRKQEHGGGNSEITKFVATPVRRSSRIRNRVTSP